jgi:hypothetical protein
MSGLSILAFEVVVANEMPKSKASPAGACLELSDWQAGGLIQPVGVLKVLCSDKCGTNVQQRRKSVAEVFLEGAQ